MKKFLSIALMLTMLFSMLAISTSAADTKVYKTYAEANDGDLLWIVDFNAKDIFDPQPNDNAAANMVYTIGDNGRSVTVTPSANATDKKTNFWGAPIKGLEVNQDSKVTFYYKAKANGDKGANNSVGVGGWLYDSTDASTYNNQYLNVYTNHNSKNADGSDLQNREAISLASSKKVSYSYVMDEALEDAEGFIQCKIEFNAPEVEYILYIYTKDNKWTQVENMYYMDKLDDKEDSLCFMLYSYWLDTNTTVKDVKFFKGIGLTDAQLQAEAPAAATTTAAETTAAATTAADTTAVASTTVAATTTPATADTTTYILLAGMVAAIALTAVVLKKKEN